MRSFQGGLSRQLRPVYPQGLMHHLLPCALHKIVRKIQRLKEKGLIGPLLCTRSGMASLCSTLASKLYAYLPIQKLEKIRPSNSSELKAPVISPSAC